MIIKINTMDNYQKLAIATMVLSTPIMTVIGFKNAHSRCKNEPLGTYIIEVWLGSGFGVVSGILLGCAWPVAWSTPILYLTKKYF